MVDIQSAIAENRWGKKKKPQDENIMACPIPYSGHKNGNKLLLKDIFWKFVVLLVPWFDDSKVCEDIDGLNENYQNNASVSWHSHVTTTKSQTYTQQCKIIQLMQLQKQFTHNGDTKTLSTIKMIFI